ncbi:hypothetical protein L873DRAFT_950717 [Choiromyces venosus 120613-1]|uniref:Uncharacterized protein n=1 Tax=Choiromyces venosus 120613-1 TaxID=1336337 RepID=A0A3N4K3K2_9PEZI|nr:hypothetical protein L873DRAFT_950717 [Choiromyces venosus 120613-1]
MRCQTAQFQIRLNISFFIYPNKNPQLSSIIFIAMSENYVEIEARIQLACRRLFENKRPNNKPNNSNIRFGLM